MTWKIIEKKLVREFEMKSFSQIIKKLTELRKIADAANHHPDFEVHSYNKIRFTLFTHDVGTVTSADNKLAAQIDLLFEL